MISRTMQDKPISFEMTVGEEACSEILDVMRHLFITNHATSIVWMYFLELTYTHHNHNNINHSQAFTLSATTTETRVGCLLDPEMPFQIKLTVQGA